MVRAHAGTLKNIKPLNERLLSFYFRTPIYKLFDFNNKWLNPKRFVYSAATDIGDVLSLSKMYRIKFVHIFVEQSLMSHYIQEHEKAE